MKKNAPLPHQEPLPNASHSSLSEKTILLVILAIALGLRMWDINWGLPHLYDEAIPLKVQWRFWDWGNGFTLDPRFFTYPGFTLYFQYLVQGIHYWIGHILNIYQNVHAFEQAFEADKTAFVIIARGTTICFDLGVVLVTFFLTKAISNARAALLACLLLAINPLHIKEAHLINVDTPLTFLAVLSLYFIYQIYKQPITKWYILTGLTSGLATATKYNGGILIVVLVFTHLIRNRSIASAVASLKDLRLIKALLVAIGVFIIFNPYIFLHLSDFATQFTDIQLHMQKGHLGVNPEASTIGFYLFQSLPYNLGWILTFVSITSIIYLLSRKEKKYLIFLAFPIIYIATIGLWAMRADRYILPAVPVLIVAAAMGVEKFFAWAVGRLSTRGDLTRAPTEIFKYAISVVLFSAVAYQPFREDLRYHRSLSMPDTRAIVEDWIIKNVKPGSAIATGPYDIELPIDHYLILRIPYNAGETEATIPFYNPRWYEDLDLVIASDYDYGRYAQEPQRFREILNFYDTLRGKWTLNYEIRPTEDQPGSTFWLYKPPPSLGQDRFDSLLIQTTLTSSDSGRVIRFFGQLGLILSSRGKSGKAKQLLEEVQRYAPENETVTKELSKIYFDRENYRDALDLVNMYLRKKPDDEEMLSFQGNLYYRLDKPDQAIASFKKVLSLNDHADNAYKALMLLYSAQNDTKSLIGILSRYKEKLPADKARLVQKQIERLTKSP